MIVENNNQSNMEQIFFKKTESEVITDKNYQLKEIIDIENKIDHQKLHEKINSEDLGVLVPLFD